MTGVDVFLAHHGVDRVDEEVNMSQSDKLDNFLLHFGVKGMKWGVRRSREQLGYKDGESPNGDSDRDPAKAPNPGSSARNLAEVSSKPDHESTDQQIREAMERYRIVDQYNSLFTKPDPRINEINVEMQKVRLDQEKARLVQEQARAKQATTQAKTSKIEKVNKLIKTSESTFDALQKADKLTGGMISKKLSSELSTLLSVETSPKKSKNTSSSSDDSKVSKRSKKSDNTPETTTSPSTSAIDRVLSSPSYQKSLSDARASNQAAIDAVLARRESGGPKRRAEAPVQGSMADLFKSSGGKRKKTIWDF